MNDEVPRIGRKEKATEEKSVLETLVGKPRPNHWPAVVIVSIPLLALFVPLGVWLTRLALGL